MSAEMVHIEGDNGPGWWVPKPKKWADMTPEEQIERVLHKCNISCPGWCTGHFDGYPWRGLNKIVHTWDLVEEGAYTMSLEQDDYLTPDGDLTIREPALVHIRFDDDQEDIAGPVGELSGQEPELNDSESNACFALDGEEAAELADKLRGESYEWAPRMLEALTTLAAAVAQPRRANGTTFMLYSAGAYG